MRSNRQGRLAGQLRIAGIVLVVLLCFLSLSILVAHSSADEKELTVITPQDRFPVPIEQREGKEYVDLQNILDSMGHSSASIEGQSFKLHYGHVDAQFQPGQSEVKTGKSKLQLTGPFLMENGRGWVPVSSLVELIPALMGGHAEYHEIPHRLFLNGGGTRFSAELKKGTPSALTLSFTAPVSPHITNESGKLKLSFSRDPLVQPGQNWKYDDPLITALHYSENEGGNEIVVEANEPLLANFSDNGRTITISTAPKLAAAPQTSEAQPNSGASTAPTANPPAAESTSPITASSGTAALGEPSGVPHARFLIVIDPSHGGSERGAALSDKIAEKDVTLAIARRLRAELSDRGQATFMIRDSDATISLDQRAVVTNTSRAAVYVAIHAGTLGHGVRVYTSMLPETAPASGAFLPWETAQSSYVRASRVLAASVIDQITKSQSKLPVAMMPAPVRPLNNIAGAAIAVEVAPQNHDVDTLTSSNYQQMIANALAAAIVSSRAGVEQAR
jgi:N-acetylmuramoyl-L-alanine amidase